MDIKPLLLTKRFILDAQTRGLPYDKKTHAAHGVAICLDKIATKVWKNSGSEWEAVSERIVNIRMHCFPINHRHCRVLFC